MATVALSSCTDDVTYTPGAEEDPDNYGVYFPTQTSPTTVEIDPADDPKVTYKVRRTKTLDAITVPVVVTPSEEGIFDIQPIVFGPGEAETEFTVSFPKAVEGTTYTCDIRIEDPHYISVYGPKDTGLSFSVIRAGWEAVTSADGSATKGKWRDALLSDLYSINSGSFNPYPEIEIEMFQRTDMPGYYRMKVYGATLVNALAGTSVAFEGRDVYTIVDARNPDKVYIPYQSTGITLNSSDGEIRIGSNVAENFSMDESTGQYGTLVDGVITFPAQSIMLEFSGSAGSFYYGNRSGMLRILLPGIVVPDYTVTLSKSEPKDGVVAINATLAEDVKALKYAVYEGVLDDGQVSLTAQELDQSKKFDGEITKTGTISISGKKTGKYTLIGCVYDEAGTMHSYTSVSFGYIAKGEEKPVVLTMGLEGTNEYAGLGVNTDNAVKFYAYGEEIESVTYGLFRTDKIAGQDPNTLLDASGTAFTAEQLASLNNKQLSFMITGLNGATGYTLLLRANNGYVTQNFSAAYTTTGKRNPGLESYQYSDFLPQDQQPSVDELTSTTWNYYAIDGQQMPQTRHKIGQVTMTKNETYTQQLQQTTLDIRGLSGIEFEKGGDIMGLYIPGASGYDGYRGVLDLYTDQTLTAGRYNGQDTYTAFALSDLSNIYFGKCLFFGAVADGYLYCVPSPIQQSQGYTFSFLFTGTTSSIFTLMYDMLLVDPAKDMGGIPETASAKIAELRAAAMKGFQPKNFVELPEFNHTPGNLESILPDLPTNFAQHTMPASAPTPKRASVETSVGALEATASTNAGNGFVMTGVKVK